MPASSFSATTPNKAMFRLYSKGCQYAIRALLQMPRLSGSRGASMTAKAVCRQAGIPEASMRKIFQGLVQSGVLAAAPGRSGGYHLNQDPSRISVRRLIEVIDGPHTFDQCILGLSVCRDDAPCPLHPTWRNAKQRLLATLETLTLQDLMENAGTTPAGAWKEQR